MVRLWEPSRTGEASLQNLTFAFKIVRYCGLWRTDGDTKTYIIYMFFSHLAFFLGYIKIFIFSFSATGNMTLFIETLSMVFGTSPTIVAIFLIMTFSEKLTVIVERLRAFISFVHSGEEHWKYMARSHSTVSKRILTMYYLIAGQISIVNFVLRPVVTHLIFGQEADLPLVQLVMFDNNGMLSFFVQYFAQVFICTSVWAVVIALDVLCFNIIVSCSHQLKVLASMIINVANTASGAVEFKQENSQAEGDPENSSHSWEHVSKFNNYSGGVTSFRGYSISESQKLVASEELKGVEETLATLCEMHQETLKTAGEMAKLLNAVMLSHYLFTSITLCMFTYNVQNYIGQSQLISTCSLLFVGLFRILILGWVSSELSNESMSVADAAYSCDWFDLSLSAKKTLIIMMARAQRPVVIKAGPTGSLSLETCKKLLEGAYSYLNVLNNMK